MRRRWSMKEIITMVHDEFCRDGKLTQKVKDITK